MKCDPEAAIRRRIAAQLTETLDTQRTTHELMTIIVLHDVFGFGRERLIKFGKALQKQYDDFSRECDLTTLCGEARRKRRTLILLSSGRYRRCGLMVSTITRYCRTRHIS